ncbi:GTD-binding domain [Dillenia turbinata]|uniref:GTD-binding domain n=1 Tax=Dillenia turbinata TaxID=194707 RepID=A0AAN8YWU5_9MAGN
MAMITKLQAEKAAVQMEALQYQRMMEEQAKLVHGKPREDDYCCLVGHYCVGGKGSVKSHKPKKR